MPRNALLHLILGDRNEQASLLAEERFWDAYVLDQPVPSDAIDPALAATIQHVHALDDAPPPDPAFAARLERELGRHTAQARPASATSGTGPAHADLGSNAPTAWSALTQRRVLLNLAATAALLAIVLASVVLTLRVGSRTPRDGLDLPLAMGPGIIDQTRLLQARFESFPDGILSAAIDRWVLQPGAEILMGSPESGGEGSSTFLVESGTLSVLPDGPIAVTLAGTTTPVSVAEAAQTALQAGDRGFSPAGITVLWRNNGAIPVRILEAKIKRGDVGARGDGVLAYTVVSESPFPKPDHPIVMTVVQVTLQPGTNLVADRVPGLEMLKVESGRLVAVDVDGQGHRLPPVMVGEATKSLRSFPPGRVFRSGDDQPVSLLLVTIANANPLGVGG